MSTSRNLYSPVYNSIIFLRHSVRLSLHMRPTVGKVGGIKVVGTRAWHFFFGVRTRKSVKNGTLSAIFIDDILEHSPSSLVPHIEERYITIFRMQNNSQIIICENISRRWFALTLRFCSSHASFYYTLFLSDLFQGSPWLTKLFTGNAQDVSWARGCWQTAHHESSHLRDSDYMDGAGSERRSSS